MDSLTSWLGPSSATHATLLAKRPVPVLVVDSQGAPEDFWDELMVGSAKAIGGLPCELDGWTAPLSYLGGKVGSALGQGEGT